MAHPTTKAHSQTKNHSPKNPQSLPFHNVLQKHSKRQPETYAIERERERELESIFCITRPTFS